MNRLGPKGLLTEDQKPLVLDWYRRKKALGTFKSKAKELGVPVYAIEHFIGYRQRLGKL